MAKLAQSTESLGLFLSSSLPCSVGETVGRLPTTQNVNCVVSPGVAAVKKRKTQARGVGLSARAKNERIRIAREYLGADVPMVFILHVAFAPSKRAFPTRLVMAKLALYGKV
jgi:hypothetical protein